MDGRRKRKLWFRTSIGVFIYQDWFPLFAKLGELIPMEAKTAMFGSPELGNQNAVSIASTALQLYDYSLNKKGIEFYLP